MEWLSQGAKEKPSPGGSRCTTLAAQGFVHLIQYGICYWPQCRAGFPWCFFPESKSLPFFSFSPKKKREKRREMKREKEKREEKREILWVSLFSCPWKTPHLLPHTNQMANRDTIIPPLCTRFLYGECSTRGKILLSVFCLAPISTEHSRETFSSFELSGRRSAVLV